MTAQKPELKPPNQQGLDIQSTPRAEMKLYALDTFPYEFPGREIKIKFEIPEFTCICPFSDFPDFATIRLEYAPNQRCVELKSLKLYINSWREVTKAVSRKQGLSALSRSVRTACPRSNRCSPPSQPD